MRHRHCILASFLVGSALLSPAAALAAPARNIVLVHGSLIDGSGWRAVHDILVRDGFKVTIVQEPLTSLDADVQATRRVIDQQDGPVILVGHSYGGALITEAGGDPKVRSLVYVAAFQPDVGETVAQLGASMPALLPPTAVKAWRDGYVTIDPIAFSRDVAGDVPKAEAAFMAASQVQTNASVFTQKITTAAWRAKKSYAIVATDDRAISPALELWMYKRAGSAVTEIKSSHVVYMSHPQAVASVIERAAREAN
ncbi:alpha/beta hydrolase [Sphingomonas sp. UYP23]